MAKYKCLECDAEFDEPARVSKEIKANGQILQCRRSRCYI